MYGFSLGLIHDIGSVCKKHKSRLLQSLTFLNNSQQTAVQTSSWSHESFIAHLYPQLLLYAKMGFFCTTLCFSGSLCHSLSLSLCGHDCITLICCPESKVYLLQRSHSFASLCTVVVKPVLHCACSGLIKSRSLNVIMNFKESWDVYECTKRLYWWDPGN